jgi:hypothetical protein
MSDPDKLAELKKAVKIYHDELQNFLIEKVDYSAENIKSDINEFFRTNTRLIELVRKTLRAYEEYVKELETYFPR